MDKDTTSQHDGLANDSPCEDESYGDDSVQRYTRATLYSLRNGVRSVQRPKCYYHTHLQTLSCWKFMQHKYETQGMRSKLHSASEAADSHYHSSQQQAPAGVSNKRFLRSRERHIRFINNNPNKSAGAADDECSSTTSAAMPQTSQTAHVPKQYIDQRSISSSHLLPAFAKRRLGIAATDYPATTHNATSDQGSERPAGHKKYEPESRSGKSLSESKPDYRQRAISPRPKSNEYGYEKERYERSNSAHEYQHTNSSSSTASSVKIGNVTQDRRIGSGRFLARDLNWDYRGHECDKLNAAASAAAEKDASALTHNPSQRSAASSKYNERGASERSSFTERRVYDRRSLGTDEQKRDKDERKHGSLGNSAADSYASSKYGNSQHNRNNSSLHGKATNSRTRRHLLFNERNEQPEWFSKGPTSQHDTIELRGFEEWDELDFEKERHKWQDDEADEAEGTRQQLAAADDAGDSAQTAEETEKPHSAAAQQEYLTSTPQKPLTADDDSNNNNKNKSNNSDKQTASVETPNGTSSKQSNIESEFNFDEFLMLDPLDNTLIMPNDDPTNNDSGIQSSRFSRWFVNKPISEEVSSKSPMTPQTELIQAIDKAKLEEHSNAGTNSLMEFLQGNKIPQNIMTNNRTPVPAITSVEELEARMRKIEAPTQSESTGNLVMPHDDVCVNGQAEHQQPPAQDMEAFKKLLRQLGSSNPGNSVLENASNNLAVAAYPAEQFLHADDANTNFMRLHKQPDELRKLMQQQILQQQQQHQQQQQQQQQQSKFMQAQQFVLPVPAQQLSPQHRHMLLTKPPVVFANVPNAPTMFPDPAHKRLEVQNLIEAIGRGVISVRFLEQELHNPHTSVQGKEIIAAVLRETAQNGFPAMHGNMPSPVPMGARPPHAPGFLNLNEMLVPGLPMDGSDGLTTQQAMRAANDMAGSKEHMLKAQYEEHELLKKRTEEQTKQQQQQQQQQQQLMLQHQTVRQSPSMLNIQQQRQNNSPTPLAFTPTSVLRKMTAEKDLNAHQHNSLTNAQAPAQHKTPALANFAAVPVQLLQPQAQSQQPQSQHQQAHAMQLQAAAVTQPRMILGGNNILQQPMQPPPTQQQQQQQTQQQQQQQTQPLNNTSQISPQHLALRNAQQQQQQQQQQMKWQGPLINANLPAGSKPLGRPILKGPLQNISQPTALPAHQLNHMPFMSKLDFQQIQQQQQQQQQQQRLKNNQTPQHMLNQQLFPQMQSPSQQAPNNVLTQLQQQHQFMQHQQQLNMQRQHQQHLNMQHHNMLENATNPASTAHGLMNQRESGALSPTSNQLAQWFSPELLAQASAGKLPLLNVNQALSLEEFERSIQQHSSAVVHN